jgi:hypothetical protein
MESIATSGNGTFVDLTTEDISGLSGIFSGTGGSLVGVSSIKITLPDGTVIDPNSVSGIGTFTADQEYMITAGLNTWMVEATFTDGSTATDTVSVTGTVTQTGAVPLPAGLTLLLGGLGVMGAMRARRKS